MDESWSIRSYEKGDEHSINVLFNNIFNKTRTLTHWDWEFNNNPEGFKVLIAEDKEGQAVAHLGALHRTIKIGQESVLASLEVDGITHPNFARRGIFVALGKQLLSESENEGTGIVIGFPNENALPGHRKLNCIELCTLPVMIRPLNFKRISKKLFTNRFLGLLSEKFGKLAFRVAYRPKKAQIQEDITINTISKFHGGFDRLWKEACSSHTVMLMRDSRYLNWRYTQHPGQHYQIFAAKRKEEVIAFVVVRVIELFGLRNGAIVDILALPNHEHVAHALVLKAMFYLEKEKVDLIACLMPKWSIYHKVLRKCGFMACPKRLNPKEEPLIIYPISKDINTELVRKPSNWFITWGDTDVV